MHTPEQLGAAAKARSGARATKREPSKFAIVRESSIGGTRCDTIVRLGLQLSEDRYRVFYTGRHADARAAYERWINPSDIFDTLDQAQAALAAEAA